MTATVLDMRTRNDITDYWRKRSVGRYGAVVPDDPIDAGDVTYTVWCIAEGAGAAGVIALRIVRGELPNPYAFEADCRAAWRSYPVPLAVRHNPYRVAVQSRPTGFLVASTKRLV